MTCFAEAAHNPEFEGYRLIRDDIERGALFDIAHYFGEATADRVEPPNIDENGEPIYSSSIEDFFYHIDDAIKEGTPFVYVLDSMDALTSVSEREKFEETKKASRAGKTTTGSYGDGKAKKNSAGIRQLIRPLQESGSILIIINQTRDNLGFSFQKKSRAGGHALRFYATAEMWSSVTKSIKKTVNGKPRKIGSQIEIRVEKNRITGREERVVIPIYPSIGIDDVGSCVDYLIEEGVWKERAGSIDATEFEFRGKKDKLIAHIEKEGAELRLREMVEKKWNEILDATTITRKPRYS
jgi:hypothetical protein